MMDAISRIWASQVGALILFALALLPGCSPSDPMLEVRALQNRGDFEGALELLRPMLDKKGVDSEVHYRYGLSMSATGAYTSALWSLRMAMEDPNWRVPAAMQVAASALATGDTGEAIKALDEVLLEDPNLVPARMLRARALARSRSRYDEVLVEVEQILELDPGNVNTLALRVSALIGLERIDEAQEAMTSMGEELGQDDIDADTRAWYCATSAIFTEDRGERDAAATEYAACLEVHPAHPKVVENAVRFYSEGGEHERAREVLRYAIEVEPSSLPLRIALAGIARGMGDHDEAEQILKEATGSDTPGRALGAWGALRGHYMEAGDFASALDAARNAYELASEHHAANPQLVFEYADALVLAGELDAALALAKDMTVKPHQALIEGRVYLLRNEPEKALARFDAGNSLWPNNAVARYYTAIAAERVGDFDQAADEYRQAYRAGPGTTDALVRLARIYMAERRPRLALSPLLQSAAKGVPLDTQSELLVIRLLAWTGDIGRLQTQLQRFSKSPYRGAAVAESAEGIAEKLGPAAGVAFLTALEGVDLTSPFSADALRALVRLSHDAGELSTALSWVEKARAQHPELAVFYEIEGLALELGGDATGARKAFAAATERDPSHALAWYGLGRMDAPAHLDRALESFDRAAAQSRKPIDPQRSAAESLIAAGRLDEAERRLDAILAEYPHDREAAELLVAVHVSRDQVTQKTADLAKRIARFGGGAEAQDRLEQIYRRLGDAKLAGAAAERARALRAQDGGSALSESAASGA